MRVFSNFLPLFSLSFFFDFRNLRWTQLSRLHTFDEADSLKKLHFFSKHILKFKNLISYQPATFLNFPLKTRSSLYYLVSQFFF